jgi:hypothetical protein
VRGAPYSLSTRYLYLRLYCSIYLYSLACLVGGVSPLLSSLAHIITSHKQAATTRRA